MSLTRLSVYLSMPRRSAMILPTKMPDAGALMAMIARPMNVAHLQDRTAGTFRQAQTPGRASRTLNGERLRGIATLEAHAWPQMGPPVPEPRVWQQQTTITSLESGLESGRPGKLGASAGLLQ